MEVACFSIISFKKLDKSDVIIMKVDRSEDNIERGEFSHICQDITQIDFSDLYFLSFEKGNDLKISRSQERKILLKQIEEKHVNNLNGKIISWNSGFKTKGQITRISKVDQDKYVLDV
jgi:hypothetical protein